MVFGKNPLARPGGDHRRAQVLGQLAHFLGCAGGHRPAPDQQHGPLGAGQQLGGTLNVLGMTSRTAQRAAPSRIGNFDVSALRLNVHGEINQHRAAPPGEHEVERPVEHKRQLVHPAGLPPLLDDGFEYAREIGPVGAVDLLQD